VFSFLNLCQSSNKAYKKRFKDKTERTMSNKFTALYKNWTTDTLMDIADAPSEYQPLAVQAARLELDSRQLTPEQLAAAKAKQDLRRHDKANKQQKIKAMEEQVKSIGTVLTETLNPIQIEPPSSDKRIKAIAIFIGIILLYQIYKDFGLLSLMLSGKGKWDFSMVLYAVPFIFLPIAGLLFWWRKKNGWILAMIYFSNSAMGAMLLFLTTLNRKPTNIPILDALFPTTSPFVYVTIFLISGGLTWLLCQKEMRTVYQIDQKAMFTALGIGIGVSLFPIVFRFLYG
jgi:hypothetical protein